jgi:general secretion pathway protein G
MTNIQIQTKKKRSFTLIELLLVVLILSALAAIAIPRMLGSAEDAKAAVCDTQVNTINTQIELFRAKTGDWPTALTAVTGDADTATVTDYFPDGEPTCPYGTAYVMGDNHRVAKHSH